MKIIDGKMAAQQVRDELKEKVAKLSGMPPGLATILVGANPASQAYVSSKIKACEEIGMNSFHYPLPETVTENELLALIQTLNASDEIHAILIQLPLPRHIDTEKILGALDPRKDADGLHPSNLGRLFEFKTWKAMQQSGVPLPCTPHGVMQLLERNQIPLSGKHVVVIGRSKLVGKPVAQMLLGADATVTMAHSRTSNLEAVCRSADIMVAAMGVPRFVKASMVAQGAVVVDVGINRLPASEGGKLCGDVDFESVAAKTSWISPVPGGVGPMTVAMLMVNTYNACLKKTQ